MYSGKVVTFQELVFACKRKLSKTSCLPRQAATGNCPDRLGWVTARLTTAITCDSEILPVSVTSDRSRQTSGHPAQMIGAVASSSPTKKTWHLRKLAFTSKYRLLKGNNFFTITMTESENNIHLLFSVQFLQLKKQHVKYWQVRQCSG